MRMGNKCLDCSKVVASDVRCWLTIIRILISFAYLWSRSLEGEALIRTKCVNNQVIGRPKAAHFF